MQAHGGGERRPPPGDSANRRSIYLQVRRSQPLTLLQVFDQPVMETNCTQRRSSTVSSQALTLLNSDFMVGQAETLAGRVLAESPSDVVGHAVRLAFARPATDKERSQLQGLLEKQRARYCGLLTGGKRPPTA